MTVKDFIKGFMGSLMNMEIKSKSFGIMIALIIVLNIIFTQLVGIHEALVIVVYTSAQEK